MDAGITHDLNVEILNAKLQKEAWYNTFWSNIAGDVGTVDTNGIPQRKLVPNKAIQILREFVPEGRDNMLLPMILDLDEPGVFGDSPLIGTGEEMALKYLRIYINQYSKAVIKKSGNMANQRLKMYNIMEQAMPQLSKYFTKWHSQNVFASFYLGGSLPLVTGTASGGYGLKPRWHPNQYCQTSADGVLATIGTEYYSKTAAEVGTGVDACATVMGYKSFLALRALIDEKLLIEPLLLDGGDPFWVFITNPYTYNLILQDSVIQPAMNAAFTSKMSEHPLFTGREFMYFNGFAIIKDPIGIRSLDKDDSSGTDAELFSDLQAGNNNMSKGWMTPCTPGSAHATGNLLIGANAIGMGVAEDIHFTTEEIDHKRTIEVAAAEITGFNRSDFFSATDEGSVFSVNNSTMASVSTAYACKNQSSAIIWTADAAG